MLEYISEFPQRRDMVLLGARILCNGRMSIDEAEYFNGKRTSNYPCVKRRLHIELRLSRPLSFQVSAFSEETHQFSLTEINPWGSVEIRSAPVLLVDILGARMRAFSPLSMSISFPFLTRGPSGSSYKLSTRTSTQRKAQEYTRVDRRVWGFNEDRWGILSKVWSSHHLEFGDGIRGWYGTHEEW